ncbi:NodB-like proteiny domain-containing protein [Mycena chlorophos]|uniref:chitin deacetylase n=1 Tax=Mycena chlorophos TaxID=658473 RepID=A0A8H6TPZ4_MYCCL|nr:NodB-like proteiny domain-containing protein [Mycena chlorophos]
MAPRTHRTRAAAAITALLFVGAQAHGSQPHVHEARANPVARADASSATSEASMAGILGDAAECVAYDYPPIDAALASGEIPPIWKVVQSVQSDAEGYALFQKLNASAPNIAPKGFNGTLNPNLNYDTATDPDCYWTATQCLTPKAPGLAPDVGQVPEPKTLGYGFDDGPYCGHNEFYDFLTTNNQKATFYYIGSNIADNPWQAQRAVADGHEVCVHTWSHPPMTSLTNEQVFGELWYTLKVMKLVMGITPTCFRPPLGDMDDRVRYFAQALNFTIIMWEYDAFDWEEGMNGVTNQTVYSNYDKLISDAKAGDMDTHGAIILTHELNTYTIGTAMNLYPQLKDAFEWITPVGVALNRTQPYVEQNYTQDNFAQYIAARGGPAAPASASSGGASGKASATGSAPGSSSSGASSNDQSTSATKGSSGATSTGVQVGTALLGLFTVAFALL